jgi:hypothetical protein
MEEKNNLIYVDSDEIEWKFGSIPQNAEPSPNTLIPLPIEIQSMYPETEDILLYCCCCKCGSPCDLGLITLELDNEFHWRIRIGCLDCFNNKPYKVFCPHLIVELELDLNNIEWVNKCQVCGRSHCKNKECQEILDKGILFKSPVEQLLSYFYQIKLDVISKLWDDEKCCVCAKRKTKKCQQCKLRVYCGKKCKKLDKDHICEPYENVWCII